MTAPLFVDVGAEVFIETEKATREQLEAALFTELDRFIQETTLSLETLAAIRSRLAGEGK